MPSLIDSLTVQNEKQRLDNNYQVAQTKNEQSKFNRMYEARLSELSGEADNRKLAAEKFKYDKNSQKLKEDFIKKLSEEGSGPMALGGSLVDGFNVQSEQGASDYPIIPMR